MSFKGIATFLACTAAAIAISVSAGASGTGFVPPNNPPSNLWAVPAYTFTPVHDGTYRAGQPISACWTLSAAGRFIAHGTAPKCLADALAATNRAHRAEGLPHVVLPTNFRSLSVAEQLLVLVDIERVSRGETPVLGLSATANTFAQQGARANSDPLLPANSGIDGATASWAANYAAGVNTLDANYQWMYTDGWDGKLTFNGACSGPRAPGCWGHRDNILTNATQMPCNETSCSLIMGAGYVPKAADHMYNSYTELFVQVDVAPTLYYTWDQAVAAGAQA